MLVLALDLQPDTIWKELSDCKVLYTLKTVKLVMMVGQLFALGFVDLFTSYRRPQGWIEW